MQRGQHSLGTSDLNPAMDFSSFEFQYSPQTRSGVGIFAIKRNLEKTVYKKTISSSNLIPCVAFFRKMIVFILVMLSTSHSLNSQDSLVFKKAIFKARIRTAGNTMDAGYITALNDSAIQIGKQPQPPDSIFLKTLPSYHYSEVESVQLWRKNATANGALIGALAGMGIGLLIGALSEDDSECANCVDIVNPVAAGAVSGILFGALGGAAVGSAMKIKISIRGQKAEWRRVINKVKKKAPNTVYNERD